MKKQLLILMLLCFGMGGAFAQDLIVTTSNDSINCKITKTDDNFISFYYETMGSTMPSKVAFDKVKEYRIGYYPNAVTDIPKAKKQPTKILSSPKFRIGFDIGYNNTNIYPESEDNSSDYSNFMDQLSSGLIWDADFTYFINNWGIGLKFNHFHSENSGYWHVTYPNGAYDSGTIAYNENQNFYGMNLCYRFANKSNRHAFIPEFSLGYVTDHQHGEWLGRKHWFDGQALEAALGAGYDFRISQHFGIGIKFDLAYSVNKKWKETFGSEVTTFDSDPLQQNLRTEIFAGLRFYL